MKKLVIFILVATLRCSADSGVSVNGQSSLSATDAESLAQQIVSKAIAEETFAVSIDGSESGDVIAGTSQIVVQASEELVGKIPEGIKLKSSLAVKSAATALVAAPAITAGGEAEFAENQFVHDPIELDLTDVFQGYLEITISAYRGDEIIVASVVSSVETTIRLGAIPLSGQVLAIEASKYIIGDQIDISYQYRGGDLSKILGWLVDSSAQTCDTTNVGAQFAELTDATNEGTIALSAGKSGAHGVCVGAVTSDGNSISELLTETVTINYAPTLAYGAEGFFGDTVAVGADVTVPINLADADDEVTAAFYLIPSLAACDLDAKTDSWTELGNSIGESASQFNFSATLLGTFKICGVVEDGLETVFASSKTFQVIASPVFVFEASNATVEIAEAGSSNIAFTISDADSDAIGAIYYKKDDASGCESGDLSNWTALAQNLPEGESQSQSFGGQAVGLYYFCGQATGGEQNTYTLANFQIRINASPAVSFIEPMASDDSTFTNVDYSLQFQLSDADDPSVTAKIYVSSSQPNCTDGSLVGWTETASVSLDTTAYNYQTSTAGTYYFCLAINDQTESAYAVSDSLIVAVNTPPTFSIDEPKNNDDEIAEAGSFNIIYTASDADSVATVSLYYRVGSAAGCDGSGISDWTEIITNLAEGTSVSQAFSPGIAGDYYVCGKATGDGASAYAVSTEPLHVNDKPEYSFIQPMGDDDSGIALNAFSVEMSATDNDDNATFTLYYKSSSASCEDGTLTGWTSFASDLAENTTSQDFTPSSAGTYYICAHINDGLESTYVVSDSLVVAANAPPSISIDEPTGADDEIIESGSFNIVYTATDADSVATVTLFYRLSSGAGCDAAGIGDWTEIATGLSEGTGQTQAFSPGTTGDYYICGKALGDGADTYAVSSDPLHVNDKPEFSFTQPMGDDDNGLTNVAYALTFSATDADDAATIAIYYKTANTNCTDGSLSGWTSVATGLAEATTSQDFTTTTAATYYFCAAIGDGLESTYVVSDSLVVAANQAPTIAIDEPTGADDEIAEAGSFNIVYTAADTDSTATITLYYRLSSSAGCDSNGISNWTEIASSLPEGTSQTQAFSPGVNGDYYICGKASGDGADTYAVSSDPLHVNDKPEISFTQPMGDDDSGITDVAFSVLVTAADADDAATFSLYYKTSTANCTDGSLTGWTSFATNLAENTTSQDFTASSANTYYICAAINDGLESSYAVSDSLVVTTNQTPTISIDEPTGADDEIVESGSFNITYTASDSDSVATITLYYRTASSAGCDAGGIGSWTQIATGLAEGTSVTQAFSPGVNGDYYICGKASGDGTDSYAVSSDPLHVNDKPEFSFTQPMGDDDNGLTDVAYSVTMAATDADDAATFSLYYKTSVANCTDGSLTGWTSFATGLAENTVSHSFTTSSAGTYYICAAISDGLESTHAVSDSLVIAANQAPTLSIDEPTGADDEITEAGSFNVVYTAADSDSTATVTLYYRLSSNAGCDAGGIGSWTQIATGLAEGTSQTQAFSPGVSGDYYICGKVSGDGTDVYAISSDPLHVNDKPEFSFVQPMGNDDSGLTDVAFSVTMSASDSDDAASFSLYYKTATANCTDGTLTGWTSFATNLAEGTTAQDFSTASAGTYYICAAVTDGLESTYAVSGSLVISANQAPTISIDEPTGANDEIAESGSFNVTYTADDSDSAATVTLYYRTSSSADCDAAGIGSWTQFATGLSEGTSQTQSFSPGTTGDYYVCGKATGDGTATYAVSSDPLHVNDKPEFSFTQPMGDDDNGLTDVAYSVTMSAADADDAATFSLYYKTAATNCTDGSLIGWTSFAVGLAESTTSQDFTTSSAGTYYICAAIGDGLESTYVVSGSLVVAANQAPTISIDEPTGANDEIAEAGSFNIIYTAADSDSVATITLYYRDSSSAGCDAGGIGSWTQIATGLSEGTSQTQSFSPGSDGDYYICGKATGDGASVYAVSSDPLHVNDAPTFSFTQPMADDDNVITNSAFSVTMTAGDTDDAATFSLYYKTGTTNCTDGTLTGWTSFATGLAESTTSQDFTPTSDGTYYICAAISDGHDTTYTLSGSLVASTSGWRYFKFAAYETNNGATGYVHMNEIEFMWSDTWQTNAMTANNSGTVGGINATVSASSEWSSSYAAYKSFNGDSGDADATLSHSQDGSGLDVETYELTIDFGSNIELQRVRVKSNRPASTGNNVKIFDLFLSNDGTNWTSVTNGAKIDEMITSLTEYIVDGTVCINSAPSLAALSGNAIRVNDDISTCGFINSYNIYWDTTTGVTTSDTKISNVSFPYSHTGLTADTTYYYIIEAVGAEGTAVSSEVSATAVAYVSAYRYLRYRGSKTYGGTPGFGFLNELTLQWDSTWQTSAMTGDSTGTIGSYSPSITSSCESASRERWEAFDGIDNDDWAVWECVGYSYGIGDSRLQVDFGAGNAIELTGFKAISDYAGTNYDNRAYTDFFFEGSNDGNIWYVIVGSEQAGEYPTTVQTYTWTTTDQSGAVRIMDITNSYVTFTGSWTSVTGDGLFGSAKYYNAGDGSQKVVWDFGEIPNGTYDVYVTWPGSVTGATDAPFTVKNGTSAFTTVDMDQSSATSTYSRFGVDWELVGSYSITNSRLQVELTNDATTNPVIADTVYIKRTGN